MSVPNQKTIIVKKHTYKDNFLQIGINEWEEACKKLTPTGFLLYLYLASNANNFKLEVSAAAVENFIGMKKSAYHAGMNLLESLGYLKLLHGNTYEFTTYPVISSVNADSKNSEYQLRKFGGGSPQVRSNYSANSELELRKSDIEIDNIDNIDKINKIDSSFSSSKKMKLT